MENFGRYEYSGGEHKVKGSTAEAKGVSLRQQLINELLPELGLSSNERAAQIDSFGDLFSNKIMEKALPLFTGDQYRRGLAGSTAYSRGFMDIINDAIQKGLFAQEDLYRRDEQSKIERGQFLESGLQNAFNRLLQIGNQGKGLNDQMFGVENANANRQQAANEFASRVNLTQDANRMSGFGDLAGLAGSLAGSQMGGGSVGGNVAGSTLSKTGSGKTSWGDAAKDPNNWMQLATIAAMLAGGCWVAAELFGGWTERRTVNARFFINRVVPEPVRKAYMKHGQEIAKLVKDNPVVREALLPIFEEFSRIGNEYMEASYATN